jgi:hypothetical protein
MYADGGRWRGHVKRDDGERESGVSHTAEVEESSFLEVISSLW